MAKGKMVTPVKHGASKGFMKALSNIPEKPHILLREDFKHALEQILFMRIWETTPRRPWGNPTSLQLLR